MSTQIYRKEGPTFKNKFLTALTLSAPTFP